jgi:hypothetical protein
MKRTPREILEWLCTDQDEFWKADRKVNIYALHHALVRWAKGKGKTKAPSQSTLARLYGGESVEFKTNTAEVLSEFFGVPVSIIRGELLWNPEEVWGMDITLTEVRLLYQMRQLQPEQRRAIVKLVEEMLPEGAEKAPVLLSPQRTPLLPPPKSTDKH